MSGETPQRIDCAEKITIRPFATGDQASFQSLNDAWIRRYFALEPKDRETLGDPEGTILRPGGQILFAVVDDSTVGCCALIPHGPREYEVGKMAVREDYQGRGIGRKLMAAVICTARESGAQRLYLQSHHSLKPALQLYESVGFVPRPAAACGKPQYSRCDVEMELRL